MLLVASAQVQKEYEMYAKCRDLRVAGNRPNENWHSNSLALSSPDIPMSGSPGTR